MTYFFLELAIFYLLFGVYFSLYQRNNVLKYKVQRRPVVKDTNRYKFSLVSDDTDLEKSWVFFMQS